MSASRGTDWAGVVALGKDGLTLIPELFPTTLSKLLFATWWKKTCSCIQWSHPISARSSGCTVGLTFPFLSLRLLHPTQICSGGYPNIPEQNFGQGAQGEEVQLHKSLHNKTTLLDTTYKSSEVLRLHYWYQSFYKFSKAFFYKTLITTFNKPKCNDIYFPCRVPQSNSLHKLCTVTDYFGKICL